nr:hypothetical protein CPGR_01133 [Mycolicibacter nonchromogenicus]
MTRLTALSAALDALYTANIGEDSGSARHVEMLITCPSPRSIMPGVRPRMSRRGA